MIYHARSGSIKLDKTQMDYVAFGNGKKTMIVIPGLAEGLRTVKGAELPMALFYHEEAKEFTVYVLSRRSVMPVEFSTRDMAEDVYRAMQRLGILNAYVMGISLGGMIAQQLALAHSEVIKKLALVVTSSRPNSCSNQVIGSWMEMAKHGDGKAILVDTAERSYTESYLKKTKWLYQVAGNVNRPKNYERFITMAKACMTHDVYDALAQIQIPTLVVGGCEDQILSAEASREIAAQITQSRLIMYEGLGHGLYEESEEFHAVLLRFFNEKEKTAAL